MQRGAADIEVLPVAAVQDREGDHIHDQAGPGHDQHGRPRHLDRRNQAAQRFEEYPADDDQQAQTIHEGRENLEALVTERPPRVRRAPADVESNGRERERHRVRQHVARVGQQRERAGENAADDFDDHEGAGQCQRNDDALHVAADVIGCHR